MLLTNIKAPGPIVFVLDKIIYKLAYRFNILKIVNIYCFNFFLISVSSFCLFKIPIQQ